MLAPILVFTAEEIFQAMPKDPELAKMPSVHLLDWLTPPGEWKNPDIEQKFALLMELRPFVLKALEEKRQTGMIGSPLEAKVILRTASDRDEQYLKDFGETLASLFVVSQSEIARVDQVAAGLSEMFPKTEIGIARASGEKCPRCWNYRVLGKVQEATDLCERCAGVVKTIMASSS